MAGNPKQKAANRVASGPKSTDWTSGRKRFNWQQIQQFRRGRDQSWYFSGQQKGEDVLLVVRKHWAFLVRPALPFLGFVLLLLVVLGVAVRVGGDPRLWLMVEAVVFLATIVAGVWFAYSHLVDWWFDSHIITDSRIISSRGLVQPTRKITSIEKVQQVGLGVETFLGYLLGFGTIHVYLDDGDLKMLNVPNPKKVKDAIQGLSDEVKAKKPKDKPLPIPKNSTMATVLEELSKGKTVAKLPNADENLPPLRGDRFLGPRRTFGGILRIPCDVRYSSGEYTVKYIQRSQYVLLRNLLLPIVLLVLILPISVFVPPLLHMPAQLAQVWWMLAGTVVLGLIVSAGLVYMNYVDDVYILTNRRIIDIQRGLIFLYERRIETDYKNIKVIRVEVPSVIQRFLDIGNIYIETEGNNPDIVFSNVDHPFILQDEISGIKGHKDKEASAKKDQQEKKNMLVWFSTVVARLEETTRVRGAPDLKHMDILDAMAYAQELGLDVIVSGEDVVMDEIEPGRVIRQSPPPGTMMEHGSKVEVVLSKRRFMIDSTISAAAD